MNREIKYKLWDTEKKLMLNCYEIIFVQGGIRASDGCTTQGWVKVNKGFEHLKATLILREFTGVKDKNGKEIYEGDKCEVGRPCVYAIGFIKFHDGCFIFKEFRTGNILRLCDLKLNGYEIEITGNIHENPELLEGIDEAYTI